MTTLLPEPDHSSSPLTGWTRRHWTTIADRTLRAVRPHASPRHALLRLPGPASRSGPESDALEGYARTALAAGFRIAGDPTSPESEEHAAWYAEGLVAGTDPDSGESWPRMRDLQQARVEAASIAIALHETRALIWDQLDPGQQERVVDWLGDAVGVQYPGNNWVWFQNVVQAFLATVGAPTDPHELDRNLDQVEQWYSGNGWYTDGAFAGNQHRAYDYYSGWAMHVYPLWCARILGPLADPQRTATDRSRLRAYLEQAQHLVGTDGAPLYQGRSLTYRFAVLAPFWVGAVFDATPLTPGRTRRLASGVLRYFAERGAWGSDGLQPIGWHGGFTPIRQWYSGPGSPYWSSKGFAGLVLPADHPVWTATEEPLALEEGDVQQSWPEPGWLLSATRTDGVVRLVNHGSDHHPSEVLGLDETVYGRLGYSGVAAPDSGEAAETSPVDSCVVLLDDHGRASHRRPLQRVGQGERWAVSRHRAHWLRGSARDSWRQEADGTPDEFAVGPWLTVASVLRGPVEVRLVRVDAEEDPTAGPDTGGEHEEVAPGPFRLRVGGYALAGAEPPPAQTGPGRAAVQTVRSGVPGPSGLTSALVALVGDLDGGVHRSEGHNALGPHTTVPLLTATGPVAPGGVTAVAVVLGGDVATPELPTVRIEADERGCAVTVSWPDGPADELRLDPPAEGRAEA